MPSMTLRSFIFGPVVYAAGRALKLWWTAPLALALFFGTQIAAAILYVGAGGDLQSLSAPSPQGITAPQIAVVLLSQVLLVPLTIVLGRLGSGGVVRGLRLGPPAGGARAYVYALLVMVPFLVGTNALSYLIRPQDFINDFNQFRGVVRGSSALVALLAICIGAPLSEELLFRGALLSSATATRIPFWPAAVLVGLAWTALHIQYSWIGLFEVFLIGIYLAWVLRRTGSLRVPIFCHAVYNSTLFVLMRLLPA